MRILVIEDDREAAAYLVKALGEVGHAAERAGDGGKIRYVSCDKLLGEAIRRIANEESVSKLFD